MDATIVSALIGAGATIIAAVLTVILSRPAPQPLQPPERQAPPQHERSEPVSEEQLSLRHTLVAPS